MTKDFSRRVGLRCPVCANDHFKYDEALLPEDRHYICSDCKAAFTHDEILSENREVIEATVQSIKDEIVDDAAKRLKKAFGKFR